MNLRRTTLLAALALPSAGCALRPPAGSRDALVAELREAETGFAQSMARRDFAAFAAYVAEDAVFINGGHPLRGKAAVLAHWQRFFQGAQAPFSWRPETAEIAGDGQLGYTDGPVSDPSGAVFARFYSTWMRRPDGRWQVVFDNGYEACAARPTR